MHLTRYKSYTWRQKHYSAGQYMRAWVVCNKTSQKRRWKVRKKSTSKFSLNFPKNNHTCKGSCPKICQQDLLQKKIPGWSSYTESYKNVPYVTQNRLPMQFIEIDADVVIAPPNYLMGLVLRKYYGWTQNFTWNINFSQFSTKIQLKCKNMKPITRLYLS